MKLKRKCEGCRKIKWWFQVKRGEVKLPTGETAQIKKLICNRCTKAVQNAIQWK